MTAPDLSREAIKAMADAPWAYASADLSAALLWLLAEVDRQRKFRAEEKAKILKLREHLRDAEKGQRRLKAENAGLNRKVVQLEAELEGWFQDAIDRWNAAITANRERDEA